MMRGAQAKDKTKAVPESSRRAKCQLLRRSIPRWQLAGAARIFPSEIPNRQLDKRNE